jgi:hypothetical protein
MEGEAFYRYRFRFPPRHFLGYVAEGAAAVTDFPAFQSLAGSLDLANLRLASYDGAVHLWESLLVQYPHTTLRPLTLYRLGWAYRCSAARGFPRESGDEAFDELIHDDPGSQLAAVAAEAKAVPWKSRASASAYSLVPGLGQIYVGEWANGIVRLAIALASAALVAVPAGIALSRGRDLSWSSDWGLLAAALAGGVGLSIDYTNSYQDAQRGVVLFNERAEAQFHAQRPDAL